MFSNKNLKYFFSSESIMRRWLKPSHFLKKKKKKGKVSRCFLTNTNASRLYLQNLWFFHDNIYIKGLQVAAWIKQFFFFWFEVVSNRNIFLQLIFSSDKFFETEDIVVLSCYLPYLTFEIRRGLWATIRRWDVRRTKIRQTICASVSR